MKWAWKIGRVAGIEVQVHATFAILILWLALRAWSQQKSPAAFAAEIAFVLALFGCIVLHELGHALTARRFGIRTRDITLLPIGGVARLERMPEDPKQEWLVAMAGPAVNVVLAALLFGGLALFGVHTGAAGPTLVEASFAERLMWVNVLLFAFNLIPAFPMDGGRALRALLAIRLPYVRATRVAAGLGQAIALLFGAVGLVANPFLIFIALFVWIGAGAEVGMVEVRHALAGIPVAHAMLTDFQAVAPDDPLSRAVQLTLAGSQRDFPVVAGGSLQGILTHEALVSGLAERGAGSRVASAMQPGPPAVGPNEPVERALARLEEPGCRMLPVADSRGLLGILTSENVFELLRFRAALESSDTGVRRGPQVADTARAVGGATRS
jgi:Zn-dependent protease